ncbi:MAG: SgcJ/EcaC family oxidoreductase [Verrucomicrobiaceae bacterium]|nr:MAG: SgcJ/EcaC family oxidoreductase [Verrucomicrobiaceae bacterium]
MKSRTSFRYKTLPAIALLCSASLPELQAQDAPTAPPAAENQGADQADVLDSLGRTAERFVAAFNGRDAAAIAALFTPLGVIVGSDGETLIGRQEINDYHSRLFAGENVPMIAVEASDVEIIAPGMAVEDGVVHLTFADDEPVRSISYTVIHAKPAGGSWLMASSRSLAEVTTLSERIKPLHWLIGEWTLEGEDGLRIDMVINLDDREKYLLGEALVTDAISDSQTVNLRIGWNPATSSVYWWTFDSDGGNACGPWARRGDEWVVNSTGITADAEVTASSQAILRDGDSMVWTTSQRMLACEALPDLTYRFVRRAPDPISLLSPEDAGQADKVEPATATDGK